MEEHLNYPGSDHWIERMLKALSSWVEEEATDTQEWETMLQQLKQK